MKDRAIATTVSASAVIGAGFVSGREIVSFFSQYGLHSIWLIFISVSVMVALSAVCLRWKKNSVFLFQQKRFGFFYLCILFVFAGSMLSAAGHMVMLLIPWPFAYSAGLVGTLCIALLLGNNSGKGFRIIGILLTIAFVTILFFILCRRKIPFTPVPEHFSAGRLVKAAIYAAGYGAMNITLARGVVLQSSNCTCREKDRRSLYLGLLLGFLMLISNLVYWGSASIHAEFPIVVYFSGFGRAGYYFCAALLYFAILTSLDAIFISIKMQFSSIGTEEKTAFGIMVTLPVLISFIGFTRIVDMLYAPLGLLCMLFLLIQQRKEQKNRLDNKQGKF